MYNVKLLNKIAKVGTDNLDPAVYNIGENVENPDAIMVRSAVMHDMEFNPELLCIARAGAGVNNIPVDRCAKEGIVVFNTPGANANGVKELAICALFLAARKITAGIDWTKTLIGNPDAAKAVEKGKSAFGGTEIKGKTLGVIGLGAIGGMVANTAIDLGMTVYGCDPYLSVRAAWALDSHVKMAANFEDIYKTADYITLHVPATPSTKNMICAETLAMMKDGVKIINLARADLVNAEDMKAALASGKVSAYVTDFPTPDTIGVDGIITIPHLGASTEESEDNCAVMAAKELDEYLRSGNIQNSVNFPNVVVPYTGLTRVCIFHDNIPEMISKISGVFGELKINIEHLNDQSKGENAYTIIDVSGNIPGEVVEKLNAIEGVNRVRVI
ncbi:MAG: 3-phosphoglycerate dehydrogenase [Ruminococcaceae bacterium]|nr:3-phosphoglycerate dehydrogenase [Oscillospiraceae bacterium]